MKCLIQSDNEIFVQGLASALIREGLPEGDLATCSSRDVMACIQEFGPAIVCVDIVHSTPPSPDILRDMNRKIDGIRIVIVGPPKDAGYTVAAVKQGVRDFWTHPIDPKEIRTLIGQFGGAVHPVEMPEAALPETQRPAGGRIVTVCGPKGGIGITLLTANLGVQIAKQSGVSVVACELAAQCGDLGTYLDLPPHYTIMDLVRQSASIDDSFVHGVIQRHASGLDVLSGPVYGQDQLDPSQIKELHFILNHLRRKYDLVLIDAGGAHSGIMELALMQSDLILLVGGLDIPSLKGLSAMYRRLIRLMYDADKIRIVINRCNAKHQIGLKEFEKKIEHAVDSSLINQFALCNESVNTGKPFSDLDATNELVQNINSLGKSIVEHFNITSTAAPAVAAANPTPKLVGKLTGFLKRGGSK